MFGEVWGVGPTTAKDWYHRGCRTLADAAAQPDLTVMQRVGLRCAGCGVWSFVWGEVLGVRVAELCVGWGAQSVLCGGWCGLRCTGCGARRAERCVGGVCQLDCSILNYGWKDRFDTWVWVHRLDTGAWARCFDTGAWAHHFDTGVWARRFGAWAWARLGAAVVRRGFGCSRFADSLDAHGWSSSVLWIGFKNQGCEVHTTCKGRRLKLRVSAMCFTLRISDRSSI
eukprot:363216-Chlamydomonas_euryale.AAC.5